VFAELLRGYWISMSSAMVRRSALESVAGTDRAPDGTLLYFDPRFSICEEADLFLRIAWAHKLDHVDSPLTRWRVRADAELLHTQAAFREAVGHWKSGNAVRARNALRGRVNSMKTAAMWTLTFLPAGLYRHAAAAYMRMARFFR
jgi:hypothetical protein